MIYIITFIISIVFFMLAEKVKYKNKKVFIFLTFIGILFPCLLSALRDTAIGTDVKVYVEKWFQQARYSDGFFDFCSEVNCTEYLYLVLTYICAKISKEIYVLFFMIQFLNIIPLVITFNKLENKINVPFAMLLYYLFFYNMSLNLARQSIAISILILGTAYLLCDNKKNFLILLIIAIGFHSSAILGVFVYIIYITSNKKNYFIYNLLYIIAIVLILLNFSNFVNFMVNVGIISAKFSNYTTKYLREQISFDFFHNAFFIVILLVILLGINKKQNKFLYSLYIVGLGIFESGMISSFTQRASYYFIFPAIFLLLPQLCLIKNKKLTKDKLLHIIIILSIFNTYWYYWIAHIKYHDTYPYKFNEVISK